MSDQLDHVIVRSVIDELHSLYNVDKHLTRRWVADRVERAGKERPTDEEIAKAESLVWRRLDGMGS